jgi:5-methylcytosine-specific restriction endonuclease McrA
MNLENQELEELFKLANKTGKKRYHKLTSEDFDKYRAYDRWRYVNGDGERGTTQESRDWIKDNSDWFCPICGDNYYDKGGKTIDHKLPRSQYPWLSMKQDNLWVICQNCNREKGERHWYEYEHYMFINRPHLYLSVKIARPIQLLQSL